jgi:hypothetical protein
MLSQKVEIDIGYQHKIDKVARKMLKNSKTKSYQYSYLRTLKNYAT